LRCPFERSEAMVVSVHELPLVGSAMALMIAPLVYNESGNEYR